MGGVRGNPDVDQSFRNLKVPPGYGPLFAKGFEGLYPRVAESTGVPLMPFLLDGVGGHPNLNLDDGIHPNVEGQKIVATNLLPYVERALRRSR